MTKEELKALSKKTVIQHCLELQEINEELNDKIVATVLENREMIVRAELIRAINEL